MRRRAVTSAGLLLLVLAAASYLYRDRARWLPTAKRSPAPVAVPGAAPIEGPYFSDGDRIGERIIAAINHTQSSLDLAIFDLTQPDITAALAAAHRRGVKIRIVADERQAHEPHSEIPYLTSQGLAVRLSRGYRGNRSLMHNKFAVFDGRLAETGSFNWTTSAESYNFENAVFLADPASVARFQEAFERIWARAQ